MAIHLTKEGRWPYFLLAKQALPSKLLLPSRHGDQPQLRLYKFRSFWLGHIDFFSTHHIGFLGRCVQQSECDSINVSNLTNVLRVCTEQGTIYKKILGGHKIMGDKYRLFLQHPLFHKFHISLSNCLYLTIIPQARVVHELIVNEARSTELAINSLQRERVE